MKTITIAGNIGKDAEIRDTKAGAVCKFSVAVKARKKDDPATWFNVSIFGKRGEALCQYLRKGSAVCVVGDLEARTYAKDGETRMDLGVVASEVTLLGGGQRESSQGRPSHNLDGFGQRESGGGGGGEFGGDDIPFAPRDSRF